MRPCPRGLHPHLPSRNTVRLRRPGFGAAFVAFAGEATGRVDPNTGRPFTATVGAFVMHTALLS